MLMHNGLVDAFDVGVALVVFEGEVNSFDSVGIVDLVNLVLLVSVLDSIGLVNSMSVVDTASLASSVSVVNWFDIEVVDIVVVIGISGVDNVIPSGTIGLTGHKKNIELNF